jgi:GTP-binding protein Era
VLTQQKERELDSVAKRYERLYVKKDFTPVEKAFPLMDAPRWASVVPPGGADSASQGDEVGVAPVPRQPDDPHALTVTFLGAPNAGKSTLVNALALSHVSAESSRRGTTVDWVKAVTSVHNTQLTLLDTPGLMQVTGSKDKRPGVEASRAAWDSIFAAEAVVLALAAGLGSLDREQKAIAKEVAFRASRRQIPLFIVITKMDKVQTPNQKKLYFSLRTDLESLNLDPVAKTMETSAKDSGGLVELKDVLCTYAKPRPWTHYFHETSDMNGAQRAHELFREASMEVLPHVIPFKMRHRVIGWTENKKDSSSGQIEVAIEVFFYRPAFMFAFYGKIHAVSDRARSLLELELQRKFKITVQAFLTPGGIAEGSK